jgi:hypothetical protein
MNTLTSSTNSSSNFYECHHPDEYVDASILIYPEPREKQLDLLPSPKEVLRFLHHLKTMCEQQPQQVMPTSKALMQTNIINLSDYHLPDEYCDASALFPYEENDGEELPSSRDLLSSFLSWLHYTHDNNDTPSATLDTSTVANIDMSNCHLPDDYIDSTVICDPPPTLVAENTASSTGDLFDSIASFLTGGSAEPEKDSTPTRRESSNNISMTECDLPDEFVDAVISCNDSIPDPTPLDRLNDKIRQVLSPIRKQSSTSSIQDNNDKMKESNRGVAWEKTKSEMSVGSIDSTVPKASGSRERELLRKRKPSTT